MCLKRVALSCIFVAFSQVTAATDTPHPGPESLTMDDKVNGAQYVFVGKAVRIYFVDKNYEEIKEPLTLSGFQPAVLEVNVQSTLYPSDWQPPEHVLVGISSSVRKEGSSSSMFQEQQERYVGRELIYFLNKQRITRYAGHDKTSQRRELLVRYYFPKFFPLKGPRDNPLQLSYLEQVKESVKRRLNNDRERSRSLKK